VTGLTRDIDAQGKRLVAADHDADIAAFAVEVRRLLDVQFQVTIEPPATEWRLAEIADPLEFVAETQAVVVFAVVHLGAGELARKGKRTHQRRTETGSFLVAPHDQLRRPAGLDTVIVEPQNRLKTAEHAEGSVVSAAADLRVEMTSDG